MNTLPLKILFLLVLEAIRASLKFMVKLGSMVYPIVSKGIRIEKGGFYRLKHLF